MEGKIFSSGSSPDNFIFDLQRFAGAVWSLSGDSSAYVYGTESVGAIASPFASLKVAENNGAKFWSLGGGSADSIINLDLSQTTGANSAVGEILDSMTSGKHWTLDASKVTGGFSFKLAADTPFTSIQGGNSGISIDAALSTVNDLYLGGGDGQDLLVASKGKTILNGGEGDDTLKGNAGVDTFVYTAGKDVIQSYNGSDVVSLNGNFTFFPTTFGDSMNYAGRDYSVSLDTDKVLTFESTDQFALINGNDTYTYTSRSIAKNNNTEHEHAITIGGDYYTSKTFNGASEDNSAFVSINASQVKHAIRVTGNDKNNYIVGNEFGGTLLGGDGDDTLVAGSVGTYMDGGDGNVLYIGNTDKTNSIGADTFVYRGNTASIQGYNTGDVVSFSASDLTITDAIVSAETVDGGTNISLNWGGNDAIIFQNLVGSIVNAGVSLKSGRNNLYVYKKDSVTWNDKSITLTSARTEADFNGADTEYTSITTVDASQVTAKGMSIVGNDNDNYIIGSTVKANSISGGVGNDTLVGNASSLDVFYYTSGNDVIVDFDNKDRFSITSDLQGSIKSGKAGRNNLTFKIDKDNSIVFRADEKDVQPRISLAGEGGGLLTANGVVNSITSSNNEYSLKLFSGAKGTIDLTDTNIYGNLKITSISASAVEKQGLTIVAKSVSSSEVVYNFAANKKRDTFEYDGGAVSITGFESGKDRLNIVDDTIDSFSISGSGTDGDVLITLANARGAISLSGAQGDEILVRANGARGYSKMVFKDSGVLENKTKNPTSVTLAANATGYEAGKTVKKITVTDIGSVISIKAGESGSVIDASAAGNGVSLYSGAKSDRFTGSSGHSDIFFYNTNNNGGKDIFNAFVVGTSNVSDSISIGGGASVLGGAKITASKNAVKFKFDSKNVLAVKGDSIKDATLQIDGTAYSYGKNAIIKDDHVSLTSQFGGTYKISGGVNYVDGAKATKNLTYKSASSGTNETLFGGTKKTTFKTSGGTDSLVGGSGDDVFFYAKGDTGTAMIADFDFKNDKLKIAGGTIRKISTIEGGGVSFNMSVRNRTDDPEIGHFNIKSSASYTKSGNTTTKVEEASLSAEDSAKVLIHANNTYYWFAQTELTEQVTIGGESTTITIKAGDLITSNKHKPKSSDLQSYKVVELNYSTNLVKSGAAVLVSNEKASLPSASTND